MELSIRSIVHPTDFSDLSFAAFAHALRIALVAKSNLHLLHVAQEVDEPMAYPHTRRLLVQWGLLEETDPPPMIATKLGIGLDYVTLHQQKPIVGILHFLRTHHCDLVVLGTHGRDGLDHWLKGSIAETVFDRSAISALFIPRGARGFVDPVSGDFKLRRVLVPVDRSPVPYRAIEVARDLPHFLTGSNVETVFLHVIGLGPRFHDARIPIIFRPGNVVQTILDTAVEYDVDLICMPTAGHHGILDALRGDTTERVLRHAPCPLLAIPAV